MLAIMDSQIDKIHRASMEILATSGIRFHHPKILELFQEHGFAREGDRVYFREDRLMAMIEKAPSGFTLRAADSAFDTRIGGEHMAFAAGYGAPAVVDANGETRNATFEDYVCFAKLVHASDMFSLNGGPLVQPTDLPAGHALPLMVYAAMLFSSKAMIAPNGTSDETRVLFDMLELVFGTDDLYQKPRVMTIANTLSPLQFDSGVLNTILTYATHRQPVIITPAVMGGATGPVSMAGTLALPNAEALAGIALTQMINPGTPVVYGMQSSAADMRTGRFSIGGPERAFSIDWGARLARAYNLPCRSGGTDNDAAAVNAQWHGIHVYHVCYLAGTPQSGDPCHRHVVRTCGHVLREIYPRSGSA